MGKEKERTVIIGTPEPKDYDPEKDIITDIYGNRVTPIFDDVNFGVMIFNGKLNGGKVKGGDHEAGDA